MPTHAADDDLMQAKASLACTCTDSESDFARNVSSCMSSRAKSAVS